MRIDSRYWLVCAALLFGEAWGQVPSYSADSIVNASDFSAGPFAPNSVLSLFGTDLARTTQLLTSDSIVSGNLPTALAYAQVFVDNKPAPLLFVSPGQINFIVPSDEIAGQVTVRVVRQSVSGPSIAIELAAAAPAVFRSPDGEGYLLAEDWNAGNAIITTAAPAQPGDMVVLYATGLGHTAPRPSPPTQILMTAAVLSSPGLQVLLDGVPVDPSLIKYAGVTPGCAGLYQINLLLPPDLGANPEVRLAIGGNSSAVGVHLALAAPAVPVR